MLRKVVATVVLVPLAVAIIAFAVANRQQVTVSFDPFDPGQPAYSKTTWLFLPIFASLIAGVLVGGAAAWHGQRRWRRAARWLEREAGALRAELATHKHKAEPTDITQPDNPPPRLKLKPPAS